MERLCGHAGRLTAQNGGLRPPPPPRALGQCLGPQPADLARDIAKNMRRFIAAGFSVWVTELDVHDPPLRF
jgi:hypothetical protein